MSRHSWTSASAVTLSAAVLSLTVSICSPTLSGAQSRTSRATFSYSCCQTSLSGVKYRPGQLIKVEWTSTSNAPKKESILEVVLRASISGPYKSIRSLKSSIARSRPVLGSVNSSAVPLRFLNLRDEDPILRIPIPKSAGAGYYELSESISEGSLITSGGVILQVT